MPLPVAIPVSNPVAGLIVKLSELVDHVPPGDRGSLIVADVILHNEEGPRIVDGNGLTVTGVLTEQPNPSV